MKLLLPLTALLLFSQFTLAQELTPNDSLPYKVKHAEPLYIDLIRDLGARKGEREWNVGAAMVDQLRFDKYEALIEYEWAVRDRLGLEVELPFTFYAPVLPEDEAAKPNNKLESLKLAAQWSFLVSKKYQASMALGYIHELELNDFRNLRTEQMWIGNVYNPFLVAAKRLGPDWHSLIYTGPEIHQDFRSGQWSASYAAHSNIHYMVPGTRNFIGIEVNKYWHPGDFDMTLRPQMRLAISDQILIGIVAGIPVKREDERMSAFVRLIYEPGHR